MSDYPTKEIEFYAKDEEIERLKALLGRAAAALQDLERFAFYCWSARNEKLPELIKELKEGAQ